MTTTDPALVSVVLVCCLAVCALWVLQDARSHQRSGRRVGVYVGTLRIDTPETWAVACLVLWVLAFPLYLRARAES